MEGCFPIAFPKFDNDLHWLPIEKRIRFKIALFDVIVSSVRRPSIWQNWVWVHPLVGSVYALPHVVISLFRDSDFEDLATGFFAVSGPHVWNSLPTKLDNRVTIYSSSRVNWKHSCSSSPEPFCGSISNEGPYKYSLLLLILLPTTSD